MTLRSAGYGVNEHQPLVLNLSNGKAPGQHGAEPGASFIRASEF